MNRIETLSALTTRLARSLRDGEERGKQQKITEQIRAELAHLANESESQSEGPIARAPDSPAYKPIRRPGNPVFNLTACETHSDSRAVVIKFGQLPTGIAVDTNGAFWKWDCGWYVVDKNGRPLPTRQRKPMEFFYRLTGDYNDDGSMEVLQTSKQRPDSRQQPMGHAEFRRTVKLATARQVTKEVLMGRDRPGMEWRRITDSNTFEHPLYGDVKLLATDGVRAVVECTIGGEHESVMFPNLTERIVPGFNLLAWQRNGTLPGGKSRALQDPQTPAEEAALLAKYIRMGQDF